MAAALLLATATVASPLAATDPATGARVTLEPASGPLHVFFFATWCPPCMAEIPRLTDLEDRYKADGYRLVLVAVPTRQTADRLRELAAKEALPGHLLFDADGSLSAALKASTIPKHVLLDRQGSIVAQSGVLDADFKQAVERLIRLEGHAQP
jgi:thiol-disulfide isomerase/thioredoxin